MSSSAATVARGLGLVVTEVARAGANRVVPGGGSLPLRATDVSPRWLEGALGLRPGAIRGVRIVDEHSGTAARARVAVDAHDDTGLPDHLFVKSTPHSYAQHVLMNLFGLGANEVLAYGALGDDPPVRVPRLYAGQVDRRWGRNIMVLEDLSETARFRTVVDSVTTAEAEAVVDAMAELHVAFWETARFDGDLAPLTGRAPAANLLGDAIRRRLLGNMKGQAVDLVPAPTRQHCRIFFERSTDIDVFWGSQPQTLLHGDPHLGNLFFEGDTPGFLDWQVALAGAGVRDVAYFANASVEPDLLRIIERGLVERYAARLDAADVPADADHLWTLYRAGITELFLAAVATSETGESMQPQAVSRVGVERAVAGVVAHDSFGVLTALVDGKAV